MFYLITCNYGTRQRCQTRAEALKWLAACGPVAQVHDLFGRLVAQRVQVSA